MTRNRICWQLRYRAHYLFATMHGLLKTIGGLLKLAGEIAIAASCIFNIAMPPSFQCTQVGGCEDVKSSLLVGIFGQSLSVTCFVWFVVIWMQVYRCTVTVYYQWIESLETYSPTSGHERQMHRVFNVAVVSTCLLITVPVNMARLFKLYASGQGTGVIVYFGLMYTHNLTLCMREMYFVTLCHVLYTKFVTVNGDLERISEEFADKRLRAAADLRRPREDAPNDSRSKRPEYDWIVLGDEDIYRSRTTGQPLADAIERLKIKHWLVREALHQLKCTFTVPIGLSLFNLCVMALWDIYYHMINVFVQNKGADINSTIYIYLWLIQYMFRFFIIVRTVHNTMKQASKNNMYNH